MKKFLFLLLALTMCLVLIACDNTVTGEPSQPSETEAPVSQGCEHSWIEATCEKPRTCEKCHRTEGTPTEHEWGEGNCREPALCKNCKAKSDIFGDHIWSDATCDVPATCSVCGETNGEALGHKWSEADCEKPSTCSVCEVTQGEALGHTWIDATCEVPKTCSVCQNTEGDPLGHFWIEATCELAAYCSQCQMIDGDPLGHTTTQGQCTRCEMYIGNPLPKYISNRNIYHKDDYFYFLFTFKDQDEVEIAVAALVEIRIENEVGETVYSATHHVTEDDFGMWSSQGNSWLAASIYIYDSEITPGFIDSGKFYYKITSDNGIVWKEFSLDINENLPVKEVELGVGEAWTVPTEWNFVVNSLQTHYACNSSSSDNNYPQYLMLTYSYENIGFDRYSSGLQFNYMDISMYDETGELAVRYRCYDHANDAEYIAIGKKFNQAQIVYALKNRSETVTVVVSHYSDYGEQTATFYIDVGDCQHIEVVDQASEPSCDVDGYTEGTHCSICNKILVEQQTIPATGHNFINDLCTICNEYDRNSDTYKYAMLKKKADAIAFSCAETVLRNTLKNPTSLQVLGESILDSDEYFRYYITIDYVAENSLGGKVTDTAYILFKISPAMDGTFTYAVNQFGFNYPVLDSQKASFGWGERPADFSLDAFEKFENAEAVSLKLIVAYPQRYQGQYIKIQEEVVVRSNDIKKKSFSLYLSTGDGKYDYNTSVKITAFYRMCDNLDDLILMDADYQKITIEGYVKVYADSTDAYIEAYNVTFPQ